MSRLCQSWNFDETIFKGMKHSYELNPKKNLSRGPSSSVIERKTRFQIWFIIITQRTWHPRSIGKLPRLLPNFWYHPNGLPALLWIIFFSHSEELTPTGFRHKSPLAFPWVSGGDFWATWWAFLLGEGISTFLLFQYVISIGWFSSIS